MKVAIICNQDVEGVINTFGIQNKEFYNQHTVNMVAASLEKAGHSVKVMDGNMYIVERIQNFMPRVVEGEQMGMVFNMAYGIQGESRYTHIPSMLEMLGIPYVGSGPSGHALALDKVMTKMIWQNQGISTPDFWVFHEVPESMGDVSYPVIVKPKMESVSFGLKVVHNEEELQGAIQYIIEEFTQPALVEQFIPGREFCIGLLGNNPIECFPVLEIDLEGDPDAIQTVDDKKHAPRKKICPAKIDSKLAQKMYDLSKKAFHSLNLRDFSRVDIRVGEDGSVYLLEINSMASLGGTGSYVAAAAACGYSYESLVNKILDVAVNRYFHNSLTMDTLEGTPSQVVKNKQPIHNRIRNFLRGRQQQLEDFLKKLVNSSTYVQDVTSINNASSMFASELANLGFSAEIQPHIEAGNQYYFSNCMNTKEDIVIICSLDNSVHHSEKKNFSASEHRLYGTGIWENKGGVAILLGALQALRFLRQIHKLKIGVLLLTDSSLSSRYSKHLIELKTANAKVVLGLQGGGADGELITSRSGSGNFGFHINFFDTASTENIALVSRLFNQLVGQILNISKADPDEVIVPHDLHYESNLFKGRAFGQAKFSVRFNTLQKYDEILAQVHRLLKVPKKLQNIAELTISSSFSRPPMLESPENIALYECIREEAKKLDQRLGKFHRWSSASMCFCDKDTPRIDGFGAIGGYDQEREYMLRSSLSERALLLAMTLLKADKCY